MFPVFYTNLIDVFNKEKQIKYKTFLPDRQDTIEEVQKWLEDNKEFQHPFQQWLETGYCHELKVMYEDLMKNRVLKNVGFVRRKVLYLYLMEKMKESYTQEELEWIEKELFTVCLYENYENIYLSFAIWRIKSLLYSIFNYQDLRISIKENWFDVQNQFNLAKQKYTKLLHLKEHYSTDRFFWLKAELYLLDIIFELNKDFTILEKCLLAYQLYRNYHSSEYHLKCGDSIYKMLYLINYNVSNDVLIQLFQMILVCYNKYIQDCDDFINKPLSFTYHVVDGKPKLNLHYYNKTCEYLFQLTKDKKYLETQKADISPYK
jgi:hypothetical protein